MGEAVINVSLKGVVNDDAWVTVQGTEEEVRRALWKISPAARKAAESKDLFGAVYAANAEYKARKNGPARSASPAAVQSNAPDPLKEATQLVQSELGGTVVSSVWEDGPGGEDTSVWGSGPSEPATHYEDQTDTDYGPPPSCPHGTKRLVTGTAKSGKNKGKPWAAWGCPAPQDSSSKCPLDFLDD